VPQRLQARPGAIFWLPLPHEATDVHETVRSAHFTGPKMGTLDGSTVWRVIAGPMPSSANLNTPLDPDLVARLARHPAHVLLAQSDRKTRRRVERAALFKRRTPPANIIGGYRFPGAPTIDLSPIEAPTSTWAEP
jgi:hypothetical protein